MKLHDSKRPRGPGYQLMLTVGGIVPNWTIVHDKGDLVRIMVFLNVRSNAYKDFSIRVCCDEVSEMLVDWLGNPEACLRDWFNYTGPEKSEAVKPLPVERRQRVSLQARQRVKLK